MDNHLLVLNLKYKKYISSGVGFDRLMRALQFLFSDPTNFDAHSNGILEFI